MAYQNVGTPRFFINVLEWLDSINQITDDDGNPIPLDNIYRTLPVNPIEKTVDDWTTESGPKSFILPQGLVRDKSFAAILGISNHTSAYTVKQGFRRLKPIINGSGVNGGVEIDHNGFSISTFDSGLMDGQENKFSPYYIATIGSFIIGNYFDMPHSPDMTLTLTREYDGLKTIQTKGGASLSNSYYHSPPKWGDLEAWQLRPFNQNLKFVMPMTGRRVWSLSFSYLSDSNLFQDNIIEQTATDSGFEEESDTTLDFMSEVVKRTKGGQFPFIFQPDGDAGIIHSGTNTQDQFAICKFDMNSFQTKQVSNGVYNMSLKIREVW